MEFILFLIYDIILLFGFVLYLPIYAYRRKITFSSLKEKFGFIGQAAFKECIWLQAVSVGEVNLISRLIDKLRETFEYSIVVSTTTLTGNRLARKKFSSIAKVLFLPLDVSFIVSRVIRRLKPKLFIAIETEIWPNLFFKLKERNIPIVIINGRISRKALKRYRQVKLIIRKVLTKCDYVGVQSSCYRDIFLSLGANENKIVVSGNMKFEGITVNHEQLNQFKERYYPLLKPRPCVLFVAGSTHYPEEDMLLGICKDIGGHLRTPFVLVIAPRHIERLPQIERSIVSLGFNSRRITQVTEGSTNENTVFILDTIGDLLYFYSFADICFVGGSFVDYGGHNILEPIYFSKPTIFGPHMDNFRDIEEIILEHGAGIKANNAHQLKDALILLLNDSALRNNFEAKCRKVFEQERQGLRENLNIISKCLQERT